jgi:hypothetical protein
LVSSTTVLQGSAWATGGPTITAGSGRKVSMGLGGKAFGSYNHWLFCGLPQALAFARKHRSNRVA